MPVSYKQLNRKSIFIGTSNYWSSFFHAKQDFEKSNRKKFCSRIATGDYDAIIIGHSMFEKIPVSIERQKKLIEDQIESITNGIQDLRKNNGERYSIK